MRTWIPWLMLVGCGDKLTSTPEEPEATPIANPPNYNLASNFGNPGQCRNPSHVVPGAGESNHLAATLLTPPAWPWTLNAVSIAMQNDDPEDRCNAGHAHTAYLWVVTDPDSPPPADTPADIELTWPEIASFSDPNRFLDQNLEPPLELAEGEHVWVAIQFGGTVPDSSCVNACADGWVDERDYWSNAAEPPYAWTPLSDFGLRTHLFIFGLGERPE